jgi:hypothetical protein
MNILREFRYPEQLTDIHDGCPVSMYPLPVSVRTEPTAVEEHRVATERDINTNAPAGARDSPSDRARPSRRKPALEPCALQRRTNSMHERRLADESAGGNRAALPMACRALTLFLWNTACATQLQKWKLTSAPSLTAVAGKERSERSNKGESLSGSTELCPEGCGSIGWS